MNFKLLYLMKTKTMKNKPYVWLARCFEPTECVLRLFGKDGSGYCYLAVIAEIDEKCMPVLPENTEELFENLIRKNRNDMQKFIYHLGKSTDSDIVYDFTELVLQLLTEGS